LALDSCFFAKDILIVEQFFLNNNEKLLYQSYWTKKANFDAVSMQVSSTEKNIFRIVLRSVTIMLTRIINEYLVAKKCIFCPFPLAHEQKNLPASLRLV